MEYDKLYKEVLGRLDAYKDNEKKIKDTDVNKKAFNKMLYKYEVNNQTEELSDEFKESIQLLKDSGLSLNDILTVLTVSSKDMKPFLTEAKNELKTLAETN